MVTGALLAVFWCLIAMIGAMGGLCLVLGMKGAGL